MATLQTPSKFVPYRRQRRSPLAATGLVFAAILVAAGCATAPEEPVAMIDSKANFDDYETFGWQADAGGDGSQPLTLVDANIRAAIATEMQRKGYVEAGAGTVPDLLIDYEAARTEKVKSNPFRIGVGVGSYGSSGGVNVGTSTPGTRNVSEGSLVIHAVDRARNAEVWRSRVSRELGKGSVNPEVVENAVAEVLSDFPARTAAR